MSHPYRTPSLLPHLKWILDDTYLSRYTLILFKNLDWSSQTIPPVSDSDLDLVCLIGGSE